MHQTEETLLLVDDSPELLEILSGILEPYYRIHTAENGAAALALLQSLKPGLILLDVVMPGMGGHELCRRLKADPRTRDIPVLFLTGSDDARDEQRGLELGAVDYLHKPLNPPLVLQRVRLHLSLRNQNLALEAQVQERTRQLRESEEKFRVISASAQDAILMVDERDRIVYWNAAAEKIFGHAAGAVLGQDASMLLAVPGPAPFGLAGADTAADGLREVLARHRDGTEFPIELSLSTVHLDRRAHRVGIARDIRVRKATEASLRRLNHALQTLSRCNEVLVHAADEPQLLHDMCRTLVEVGHYRLAWVGVVDPQMPETLRPVAAFGPDEGFLARVAAARDAAGQPADPAALAVRDGAAQVSHFAADSVAPAWEAEAARRGYACCIALPLGKGERMTGALTLYADTGAAADAEELALLAELADDLAFGIATLRVRSERDEALKDLQLAAKVFEESKEAIVITDTRGDILATNRAFTALTGYYEEEVLGRNPRLLKSDRHDAGFYANLWASIRQSGQWMGEIWNRRKDGEVFPALQSISAVHDAQGVLTHYVSIFADISYRKESEERIRYLTQHDALTGLANRALLSDRLEQALLHAHRSERLVAAVLLNIDRLKLINDGLGHAAGDLVLQEVGRRLSRYIRPGDTVARLAGDEFMVVFSELASENDAAQLARRLLGVLSEPMTTQEQELTVTASLGVALFPKDGLHAATLLRNADAAMHRAKELGRNSVQFYAPEMNARLLQRLELEAGLRRAIERREFILAYQPKVELASGQVVGAEVLLRWLHPTLGMVSPADFIPLAEETGLIVPIGEWVVAAACRQLRNWQQEGFSDLALAVNLSARQFQQENLADMVAAALRDNGLDPRYLELEVTESAAMHEAERTIAVLQGLKALGVRISLDDFGTGYSSLNYLKRFPIDALKIDQSFVRDITNDPDDAAIAGSIISLAHNLKLTVIAEGVETEAQLNLLRRQRCDQIQGYYFSRPLEAAAFGELLRSAKALTPAPEQAAGPVRTLLLVDDDRLVLTSLARILQRDNYRILTASDATQAFELLALHDIQVILSDQRMPHISGTEFFARVKELYPDTMRLVLSGNTDLQSLADAVNHGAIYKFLSKPWDDDALRARVREAFLFHEAQRDRPASTIS